MRAKRTFLEGGYSTLGFNHACLCRKPIKIATELAKKIGFSPQHANGMWSMGLSEVVFPGQTIQTGSKPSPGAQRDAEFGPLHNLGSFSG